jgi:antitoxin MazE
MRTEIQKWGDGLAIRIPESIAAASNINAGSVVGLSVSDGRLTIAPVPAPAYSLDDLLAQVTEDNLHPEISTGTPTGEVRNGPNSPNAAAWQPVVLSNPA